MRTIQYSTILYVHNIRRRKKKINEFAAKHTSLQWAFFIANKLCVAKTFTPVIFLMNPKTAYAFRIISRVSPRFGNQYAQKFSDTVKPVLPRFQSQTRCHIYYSKIDNRVFIRARTFFRLLISTPSP